MYYKTGEEWRNAQQKKAMVFGMSGLGKTRVSNILRESRSWFHYCVDYRIGTRYLGEHIVDNLKREAMKTPFLAELLLTDSIKIGSNISFDNLAPLSTYLGKPGDPARGGLNFQDYLGRQNQHREGETSSLLDTPHFAERAQNLYGYPHFICDSGGSICEVVDPEDKDDPVLKCLSETLLLVWIEGSDTHTDDLIQRFDKAPKPMYYHPNILMELWSDYLSKNNMVEGDVNPDEFIRWAYARALKHRQPLYRKMAQNWGVTLQAEDVAQITCQQDFVALVAQAIDARM